MESGKHIVLGITGGIAVYKACELVRLMVKNGCEVRVVMTENAAKFVSPLTFETLTGNRVYTDTFDRTREIGHISLSKFADLCVVAPATANLMAKCACGLADDLLSTTLLAMKCPVLIAPAMNTAMWVNPATQANCETLKKRGFYFVGPESGSLACGDTDVGRMSEPETILSAAEKILTPKRDYEGLNVLVTAGPTREMLDPVRYLTNRSTGRMGYAIAQAARDRGAKVTLVSGPVELKKPGDVETVDILSTKDLLAAMLQRFEDADVVIQSAAPADFTPEKFRDQKIKKDGEGMTLKLAPTPDVAKTLGERKKANQTLVVFAAETDADIEKANEKRKRKNADLIVLNDVTRPGAGFAGDTNIVTIISENQKKDYPLLSKREVADIILDQIQEQRKCATQK